MASAGDATQEGAHSQSQGGSAGNGRYQSQQDCQHVHLSVYLSTHIKCRLMTAKVPKFCPLSISEQQKLIDQGGGKVGHFCD